MSLKDIRTKIASEAGYHPDTSTDDFVYLNKRINDIAEDLHSQLDLVGSLFEIIIFYDQNSKLVSLPWFVGSVRGARYYDSPYRITLRDIRPRYGTSAYGIELIDFREIGLSSLAIQPENWTTLTFTLPEGEVEDEDIIISVVGKTPTAEQAEEKVTLLAGANSVTSSFSFQEAPRVIEKNRTNKFNIEITDAGGVLLAIIPNSELKSQYFIWQVRDDILYGQVSSNSLEILYKERYRILTNDSDEFLYGRYDDAIFWIFMDEFWSKQEGKIEQAETARNMWAAKLANVNKDKAKGKKAELQAVSNKYYGIFDRSTWKNTWR